MKKEHENLLLKAPWSGQKAGGVVRLFALVFVLCGIFTLGALAYFGFKDGVPQKYILFVLGMAIGVVYFTLLFGHVAVKGRAPFGWLPWNSGK